MNAEIINIGDELLIGQVINTNAAWMAAQLNLSGFRVYQVTVISDSRGHIMQALADAEERAEVVLVSGGIGPTKDDLTKQTLCEFFNTRLVFNQEAYGDVEALFARRGYAVTELNRQQAELPENCTGYLIKSALHVECGLRRTGRAEARRFSCRCQGCRLR